MRRVGRVLTVVLGAVVALHPMQAQAPIQTPMTTTAVPHVGIVVSDLDEAIRRFQDVFGVMVEPARDVGPLVVRGTPPPDSSSSRLRVAAFKVGNMGFEIVEPVAGPSPHRRFLDRYGQGLQHVAFEVKNSQAGINYLVSKGGTLTTANDVDMQDILGFSAEVRELNAQTLVPEASRVMMQTPLSNTVISHIGIVVPNIEKTSQAFSEIFGVPASPVRTGSLTLPEGTLSNAVPLLVRFTNFIVGNMRFELVQPVSGPSPHQDHLDRFGQSLHHIGFELKIPKMGIDYLVSKGGRWRTAPSVDMRTILGFQAELLPPP